MPKKGMWLAGFLFSAILAFPADHYKVAGESGAFYFGHISFSEAKSDGNDPVILREGSGTPEPATLNAPVGPGDVIRTTESRRCEVQFDTGTIVRLDVNTELKVETILAGSLSKNAAMSNFVLSSGRIYVMYKEYDDRETFQVLTSNAAVKPKHASVAVIAVSGDGPTEVRVRSGKASVLFGAEAEHFRTRDVRKLERLIVRTDGSFEESAAPPDTEFEKWNETLNASFVELHKGISPLPKPLRNLPLAVFNFAQRFGNANGEWLWDDLYGYVWRPFLNDSRYPWGNWTPYVFGRWTEVGGSMFWVPEEPWGWVPYHLGLWQWDRKLGWFWLPGSLFAPAWTAWDFFEGYYAWRPWTLFDWFFQGRSLSYAYAYGFDGMYGSWPYYGPGHFGPRPPDKAAPPLTQIRKDQLKKKEPSSVSVPKEMKKVYAKIVVALGRNDGRLIESLKGTLDRTVFVAREDLNASRLQERVLTGDRVRAAASGRIATPNAPAIPLVDALFAYRQNAVAGGQRPGTAASVEAEHRPLVGPAPPGAVRFRDWNPDIRLARALGVRIDYSSRTNEILCPELKISSRYLGRLGLRLSSEGLVQDFSRGASGGYNASGTASSGQISSQKGHDHPASQQGSKADAGTTKKD